MVQFLGTVNIALALALLLWPLWFSRKYLRLPALNPLSIVMLVNLPVQVMKLFGGPLALIEEGLFDPGYQFAVAMGNTYTLAQLVGTIFFLRVFTVFRVDQSLPFRNVVLKSRDLSRASWFFVLVYCCALYFLASGSFGLSNWIANPREGYQTHRVGQGHWYALAMSALAASMLLSFLSRPRARSILLRTPLFFAMGYLLGTKGILLQIFIFVLVFLWFIGWPYLARLLLFGAPVVFAAMVLNLYLALADSFDIQAVIEYFDYYKNAADFYIAVLSGEIKLYWGEIAASSLWSYVPRNFWPDKPFVYGVTIINEIFFPGAAEMTNTPAFGGAVEQYADFGLLGVLVFGFLSSFSVMTALFAYLTFKRPGVDLRRITLATVLLLLVQFAPGFGAFFPGALYLLLLLVVLLSISLMKVRRLRRHPTPHGLPH